MIRTIIASGGNLFAGGRDGAGGIFLSTNNGTSWTAVNNGLTNLFVNALVANGGNIFAGTGDGGVFLSTNNGTSWTAVNNGLTNLNTTALVANGGNVFAGGSGGVFLSTNNGTSWTAVNNGLTGYYLTVLALVANGGNIFAGTNGYGVYFTTNNGGNWTAVNNGLPANSRVYSLAVNGSNLFAGTNGTGVYLSTNNGTSWTAVNTGITNSTVNSLTASGGYVFAGTESGGVFLTTNNGTNWVDFNTGWPFSGPISVYALTASGSYLFEGTPASVWRRLLSDVANLPAAPILSSPANGSTNMAVSPNMVWSTVSGATSYRLQVSTSSSFSSMVINDTAIIGISRTIGPIAGNTTYYWRVDAKNSYGWGAWSSVWNFTTRPAPVLIPYTPNPTSNRCPQLGWYANTFISTYRIEIDTNQQFTSPIVSQATTDTFYLPTTDFPYGTIHWHVRNDADALNWSPVSSVVIYDSTSRLVAHWAFNEASDTVLIDSSGNCNTAYIHTATRVPGVSGNALSFNGTSDYAHANNSASLAVFSQISIECWVKARQLDPVSGYGQTFIKKEKAYSLGIGRGGKIGFHICDQNGGWHGGWTLSKQSIDTSMWHHIAGVWDGATMKVYINGILDSTFAYNGTAPSATKYTYPIYFGEFHESAYERLNGTLDEVKLYNFALTADTIAAHSNIYVVIGFSPVAPLINAVLKAQAHNSILTISFPSAMHNRAIHMAVYSVSGRVVMQKMITNAGERLAVPIPNLAIGMYILSVRDVSKKQAIRFIVVK